MTNALTVASPNADLLANVRNKDTLHRLKTFVAWLDSRKDRWITAKLNDYRDYLVNDYRTAQDKPLSPASVHNYVSTVRRRYVELSVSNALRDDLYSIYDQQPKHIREKWTAKEFVDETIERIRNNANPNNTRVNLTTKMHRTDQEDVRLTLSQAKEFATCYGLDTALGVRNTAVISMALATGLRVDELVKLDIKDLKVTYNTRPGVEVKHGKGDKQRVVLYMPEFSDLMRHVWNYIDHFQLKQGWLFRGFTSRHYSKLSTKRLSVRMAQQIIEEAPHPIALHAHRLRHSYARIMHIELGYPVDYVREQMGHSSTTQTLEYIGGGSDIRLNFEKVEKK